MFRGATQVATLGAVTSYTDTNVAPGTHSYTVRAVDAAGNVSDPSNAASATVADTTKPTPPTLTATPSAGQVALSWQGATDNVGVSQYRLFRGTTQIATLGSTVTSYTDAGLGAGAYSYTARAVDAAGNVSDPEQYGERDGPGHHPADHARQPDRDGRAGSGRPELAGVDGQRGSHRL